MKVENLKIEEKFQPIEIKITLESKEELRIFREITTTSGNSYFCGELFDFVNKEWNKLNE